MFFCYYIYFNHVLGNVIPWSKGFDTCLAQRHEAILYICQTAWSCGLYHVRLWINYVSVEGQEADLVKAYDWVLQEKIWYTLSKRDVSEYLVQGIMFLYSDYKTAAFVDDKSTNFFFIQVGIHQGSVLKPIVCHWIP